VDGLGEIAVFARVVEARSFSRAAHQLGMSPSGVSRAVARLEERLDVRLINRTTRSSSLSDDGAAYYDRCREILAQLEEADRAMARARGTPRGRLRVDAPLILGEHALGPALPSFMKAYPDVALDVTFRDQIIDPVAEGVDLVLRLADLGDSSLIAKKVGALRTVIVGAPAYFAAHGRPRVARDLAHHRCIGYLTQRGPLPWRLHAGSGSATWSFNGRLNTNGAAALRAAAVAGLGLIQVFAYHVEAQLRAGTLEEVAPGLAPPPRPLFALYPRSKGLAPKVRVFIAFVSELFADSRAAGGR
jgi:DNA-binding transcriptional LysR family regulator